jgi:hypothetical protein
VIGDCALEYPNIQSLGRGRSQGKGGRGVACKAFGKTGNNIFSEPIENSLCCGI